MADGAITAQSANKHVTLRTEYDGIIHAAGGKCELRAVREGFGRSVENVVTMIETWMQSSESVFAAASLHDHVNSESSSIGSCLLHRALLCHFRKMLLMEPSRMTPTPDASPMQVQPPYKNIKPASKCYSHLNAHPCTAGTLRMNVNRTIPGTTSLPKMESRQAGP